ncbi:hypothetical protein [Paenibacillus alginolyticus]|uniref:Uncharacterized protein n=1 Tax=Paenibacillus alginolyticus TaxID=59839 RepID=A0ABT4GQB8_9BACL|nr:hypothetical protein [Paenibacillus alginolyticus]MCY9698426.1 hypothetical protein [Paenibacillus alginolyticus]MEC0142722.1 hypothetical protein [Paenibacillus alginolyticus]
MLKYQCDQEGFSLMEQRNGDDFEFTIVIKDIDRYLPAIKQVREHFDRDSIYTDVLFYVHPNNEYRIIVRHDFYIDFILSLFKYRFVNSVNWN